MISAFCIPLLWASFPANVRREGKHTNVLWQLPVMVVLSLDSAHSSLKFCSVNNHQIESGWD